MTEQEFLNELFREFNNSDLQSLLLKIKTNQRWQTTAESLEKENVNLWFKNRELRLQTFVDAGGMVGLAAENILLKKKLKAIEEAIK